jgi:hypothetical protein
MSADAAAQACRLGVASKQASKEKGDRQAGRQAGRQVYMSHNEQALYHATQPWGNEIAPHACARAKALLPFSRHEHAAMTLSPSSASAFFCDDGIRRIG